MAESHTCPQCGRPLSDSAPKGLCSRCLYEAFLAPPDESGAVPGSREEAETASGRPGTIRYFGDYELLEEIAHGGMGVVFLARQRSLDRLVAVKLIRAGYLARADQIIRFHREARAAAGLQHPHIVAIHEVGEHRGQHYYSMDFVAGYSLARIANGRPQPPEKTASWVRKIAEAIHYAHGRHVIHRDLKPSNILIDAAGEPHVADFGLAKFVSQPGEIPDPGESDPQGASLGEKMGLGENEETGGGDHARSDSPAPASPGGLTTSGTILGSPDYMPPEQAEGRHAEITARTDVWSLGAILYELLTGRPPFNASSSIETIRLVCEQEPVPPRRLNPSIPRDLETICLKCLQKPPARRYATSQELADDLGRFLRHEPVHARPIRAPEKLAKWIRRHPARAALITVSVLATAAYLVQLIISHGRLREQRYAADIHFASRSIERGQLGPALSVLEALRPRWFERDLRGFEWWYYRRFCEGVQERVLTNETGSVVALDFSPDGRWLASSDRNGFLRRWNTTNWQSQLLASNGPAGARKLRFSRDGTTVALGDGQNVWLSGKLGSEPGSPAWHGFECTDFEFLNFREMVVSGQGSARIVSSETREPTRGLEHDFRISGVAGCVAVSGDHSRILVGGGAGWVGLWRDRGTPPVELERSFELEPPVADQAAGALMLAANDDGSVVATSRRGTRRVILWRTSHLAVHAFAAAELEDVRAGITAMTFSPDGNFLATSGLDGTVRLWNGFGGTQAPNVVAGPEGRNAGTAISQVLARRAPRIGDAMCLYRGHLKPALALAFAPDSETLASGAADGTIRLWPGRPSLAHAFHPDIGPPLAFSVDSRWMLTRSPNGSPAIRESHQLASTHDLGFTNSVPLGFLADRSGARLARRDQDRGLIIVETFGIEGESKMLHAVDLIGSAGVELARPFAFSDGVLLARKDAQTLRAWNTGTGEILGSLEGLPTNDAPIALSRRGRLVATLDANGKPFVSDIQKRTRRDLASETEPASKAPGASGRVRALAFSPDDRWLIAGDDEQRARVWSVREGRLVAELVGHSAPITALAVSPDGETIGSGDADGLVHLWHRRTGRQLTTLDARNAVRQLLFSPDGTMLAAADAAGLMWYWRAPRLDASASRKAPFPAMDRPPVSR